MDANQLRALHAPLKKQYREQPETARIPARAEAVLDLDRIACRVPSWAGESAAGLHPAAGGDGSLGCSADMLLEALVACAGVTISVACRPRRMGVTLRGGRVIAEGQWVARGTLGGDRESPIGLTDMAVTFALDTDADAATVQRLVETSERYRVIYQTLRTPPAATFGCTPDRRRGPITFRTPVSSPTPFPGGETDHRTSKLGQRTSVSGWLYRNSSSSTYSSRLFSEAWPENCLSRAMWTPCATPLEIAPWRRLCPANAAPSSPASPVHFLTTRAIELVSIGLVPIR